MNETTTPDGASGVPWPTSDHLSDVLDISMLPGNSKMPSAALGWLNRPIQGACDTPDRPHHPLKKALGPAAMRR